MKVDTNYKHLCFADSMGVPIMSPYFSNVYFATNQGIRDLVGKPNKMFKNRSVSKYVSENLVKDAPTQGNKKYESGVSMYA